MIFVGKNTQKGNILKVKRERKILYLMQMFIRDIG